MLEDLNALLSDDKDVTTEQMQPNLETNVAVSVSSEEQPKFDKIPCIIAPSEDGCRDIYIYLSWFVDTIADFIPFLASLTECDRLNIVVSNPMIQDYDMLTIVGAFKMCAAKKHVHWITGTQNEALLAIYADSCTCTYMASLWLKFGCEISGGTSLDSQVDVAQRMDNEKIILDTLLEHNLITQDEYTRAKDNQASIFIHGEELMKRIQQLNFNDSKLSDQ